MRIEGSREFDAPPDRVFAALTDPDLIARALPMLGRVRVRDDAHWEARVGVPHVPGALRVAFELADRRPPEHALLRGHGRSLGASARLESSFDLTPLEPTRTAMRWSAEVKLGGLLSRLGDGVLEPLARQAVSGILSAVDRRARLGD